MFVALGSRHPRHGPAVGSRGLRNRTQKGTVRASVAAPALVWAPSITTLLILATLELPGIASGAGRSQSPSYLRHRVPYTRTTSLASLWPLRSLRDCALGTLHPRTLRTYDFAGN